MDPKKVDRIGKGVLAIVVFAAIATTKKYGPRVVEVIKKIALRG